MAAALTQWMLRLWQLPMLPESLPTNRLRHQARHGAQIITRRVGGATNSQHVKARAMDLPVSDPQALYDHLCKTYPGKYGFGVYKSFVHIDTRTDGPARWGSVERHA